MPDVNTPLPDPAHEGLRQSVVQALADMGDGLSLTDVLFELVDVLFLTVDDLTAQIGDLTTRLTVLETPDPI